MKHERSDWYTGLLFAEELEASNECKTNKIDLFEGELQLRFQELEKDYDGLKSILHKLKKDHLIDD
jgi:hypothetical protein